MASLDQRWSNTDATWRIAIKCQMWRINPSHCDSRIVTVSFESGALLRVYSGCRYVILFTNPKGRDPPRLNHSGVSSSHMVSDCRQLILFHKGFKVCLNELILSKEQHTYASILAVGWQLSSAKKIPVYDAEGWNWSWLTTWRGVSPHVFAITAARRLWSSDRSPLWPRRAEGEFSSKETSRYLFMLPAHDIIRLRGDSLSTGKWG